MVDPPPIGTFSMKHALSKLRESAKTSTVRYTNLADIVSVYLLQNEMCTKAELAFKALDKDNSGYISEKVYVCICTVPIDTKEISKITQRLLT